MTKTAADAKPARPLPRYPTRAAARERVKNFFSAMVDRHSRAAIVFVFVSSLGLDACAWPTIYRDHQLLRVRVVRIWTNQEMADDWQARLRQLADAPPLESYLSEYRRETVFLGNAGRNNRYEYSLARSSTPLVPGDIVEIDIGTQSHAPRAFDDLPMVKRVVCRVADVDCLGDPKRGATLGLVKD